MGSAINQKTKELTKTGINQKHSESPNPLATGIFVLCGPSNVSVIDIDGTTGMSMAILHQLAGRCNLVAETRKGIHLFFRHHPKLPRAYANPVTKVDVRSSGQTVKGAPATDIIFVYPSRYPVPQGEGPPYQWLAVPTQGTTLSECPEEIVSMFAPESTPTQKNVGQQQRAQDEVGGGDTEGDRPPLQMGGPPPQGQPGGIPLGHGGPATSAPPAAKTAQWPSTAKSVHWASPWTPR